MPRGFLVWGSRSQAKNLNSAIFLPFLSSSSFCSPPAEPILPSRPRSLMAAARRVGQGWPSHAVQHTHGISRPLLDGPRARREARDLRGRRGTAGQPNPQRRSEVSLAGVARKIAHHVLVFGRSRSGDLNHDAVIRIGGEAPRRQTHSSLRHRSHGNPTSDCHLGSSWHSSRWKAGSTPDLDWAR